MFDGPSGALRSKGRHSSNENNLVFEEVSRTSTLRGQGIPYSRGRQWLRETSRNGKGTEYPQGFGDRTNGLAALSRIFDE